MPTAGRTGVANLSLYYGRASRWLFGRMVKLARQVTFVEILEDNRCPSDVTCIREGRVRCRLDVSYQGTHYEVTLAQPGLSYEYESGTFEDYRLSFKIEPYPLSEVTLSAKDYYIYLTIFKN